MGLSGSRGMAGRAQGRYYRIDYEDYLDISKAYSEHKLRQRRAQLGYNDVEYVPENDSGNGQAGPYGPESVDKLIDIVQRMQEVLLRTRSSLQTNSQIMNGHHSALEQLKNLSESTRDELKSQSMLLRQSTSANAALSARCAQLETLCDSLRQPNVTPTAPKEEPDSCISAGNSTLPPALALPYVPEAAQFEPPSNGTISTQDLRPPCSRSSSVISRAGSTRSRESRRPNKGIRSRQRIAELEQKIRQLEK